MASPKAVSDLVEQGAPAFDTAVPILSQLRKAEVAEREVRWIAYHILETGNDIFRFGDSTAAPAPKAWKESSPD